MGIELDTETGGMIFSAFSVQPHSFVEISKAALLQDSRSVIVRALDAVVVGRRFSRGPAIGKCVTDGAGDRLGAPLLRGNQRIEKLRQKYFNSGWKSTRRWGESEVAGQLRG